MSCIIPGLYNISQFDGAGTHDLVHEYATGNLLEMSD